MCYLLLCMWYQLCNSLCKCHGAKVILQPHILAYYHVPIYFLYVADIKVQPIQFGDQMQDCVPEGSDVLLTCNVTGYPLPEVLFLKDSVPIMLEDNRITSISSSQVHPYVCMYILHIVNQHLLCICVLTVLYFLITLPIDSHYWLY